MTLLHVHWLARLMVMADQWMVECDILNYQSW